MADMENLLSRGVEEVIDKEDLIKKLKSKKLRVYLGIDPTAPDIHLGNAVPIRKLAEFQKLGHTAIFLIGDFTATIGDPSGQNKTRPQLSKEEIEKNAKTYLDQVGKILDIKKAEIRRNSQWYKKEGWKEVIELLSKFTISRILERDDFEKRLKENTEIKAHEIIYPLMQAWDCVQLKADVQIGGTDQKFNMLMGRRLNKDQNIMTLKLLVGTDGINKMSKSLGNYIGITEKPNEMYGKIMSIPDSEIENYFELCTDVFLDEVKKIKNPRNQKARLAFEIVKLYHGEQNAKKAEEEFNRVFKAKLYPSEIPEVNLHGSWHIIDLLTNLKLAKSRSEATRLIEQSAVKIDAKTCADRYAKIEVKNGMIVQVGKRRFVKINTKNDTG